MEGLELVKAESGLELPAERDERLRKEIERLEEWKL